MKVLLTGATGLLGSHMADELPRQGYHARAFVRESSDWSLLKQTGAEIVRGNLHDPESLKQAAKGCGIVIHAAANASQWPTGFDYYRKSNVDATVTLAQQSMLAGVERFIFVSSANAFGPGTKDLPGNELTPFTATQFSSGYMRSKYEAQRLVLEFSQKSGFPVVVVNPCFMLGKYDTKPGSGKLLLAAYGRKLMPCPPGGKNFIYAGDAAKAIVQAIRTGRTGECYLLGNENLSYFDFFRKMKAVCGYPEHLIPVPRPLIKAAGVAGSFYEKVTGKVVPLNHVNANLLSGENYYSAGKAIRELQLPRTPVEAAIAEALKWFGKV